MYFNVIYKYIFRMLYIYIYIYMSMMNLDLATHVSYMQHTQFENKRLKPLVFPEVWDGECQSLEVTPTPLPTCPPCCKCVIPWGPIHWSFPLVLVWYCEIQAVCCSCWKAGLPASCCCGRERENLRCIKRVAGSFPRAFRLNELALTAKSPTLTWKQHPMNSS